MANELEQWEAIGATASFWWRDDDAVSDSDKLRMLLECAGSAPIAISVIPDLADASLARRLKGHPNASVLQHGWRHINYSAVAPFSEYPAGRNREEVLDEFRKGRQRLDQLFGEQNLPVFAPPWHGFHESYLELLTIAGLKGLSRKGPQKSCSNGDLRQVNVHSAPMNRLDLSVAGSNEDYLLPIIDHLRGKRLGIYASDEPTGIISHHLVQEERSFDVMRRLRTFVELSPAASWKDARAVFSVTINAVTDC